MAAKREIIALVPARGGSKGVPGKNLKRLSGHPLIAYSVAVAQACPSLCRVIVSTDSHEIAETAKRYGAEVPFLRPTELAADHSPDIDYFLHALEWIRAHGQVIPELVVLLRPTTPLRDAGLIERAIQALLARPEATSLRSVHPAQESPFKWFLGDVSGYLKPIVPTMSLEETNLPRQKFPPVLIPDGYVDVLRVSHVLGAKELYGPRILAFESPVCVEVDTAEDFKRLEYEARQHPLPLLRALESEATT